MRRPSGKSRRAKDYGELLGAVQEGDYLCPVADTISTDNNTPFIAVPVNPIWVKQPFSAMVALVFSYQVATRVFSRSSSYPWLVPPNGM